MVLCIQCQFMADNKTCRLNPPQIVGYLLQPDCASKSYAEQNPCFNICTSSEFPDVSNPGCGCFKGKLKGTYQREII